MVHELHADDPITPQQARRSSAAAMSARASLVDVLTD